MDVSVALAIKEEKRKKEQTNRTPDGDMADIPSCTLKYKAITKSLRHLLLKHHLIRMNPVALSVFTKFFRCGMWLREMVDDSEETDDNTAMPTSFQNAFGSKYKDAPVHPMGEDDLQKELDEYITAGNVRAAIQQAPWAKSSPGVPLYGSVDLVGLFGSEMNALVICAGIALQYFTKSSLFAFMVRNEWSTDEAALSFPTYSPDQPEIQSILSTLPPSLQALCRMLHSFLQSLVEAPRSERSAAKGVTTGSSDAPSTKLPTKLPSSLPDMMAFFGQEAWIYDIERILNHASVPITLYTADLAVIPCVWKYEFVNHLFKSRYASRFEAMSIEAINDIKYDAMHMVSLLQRASRNSSDIQLQVMGKLAAGLGTAKFGLINSRPRATGRAKKDNVVLPEEGIIDGKDDVAKGNEAGPVAEEEFLHLICLAPIFAAKDADEDNRTHAYPVDVFPHSKDPAPESVGCFGFCFGGKSFPFTATAIVAHLSSYCIACTGHSSRDSARGESSLRRSASHNGAHGGSGAEITIVAVHADMSRPDASTQDVARVSMTSFVLARLFE